MMKWPLCRTKFRQRAKWSLKPDGIVSSRATLLPGWPWSAKASHDTNRHSASPSQRVPSKSRAMTSAMVAAPRPTPHASIGARPLASVDPRTIEGLTPMHAVHGCEHMAHEPAGLRIVGTGDDVAVGHHVGLDHIGAGIHHIIVEADIGACGAPLEHACRDHDPRSVAQPG